MATRNLSGRALEERGKHARRQATTENDLKLKRLLLEKDERQYRSYLGNVNTLNQMKQAFKDVYPALKEAN